MIQIIPFIKNKNELCVSGIAPFSRLLRLIDQIQGVPHCFRPADPCIRPGSPQILEEPLPDPGNIGLIGTTVIRSLIERNVDHVMPVQ